MGIEILRQCNGIYKLYPKSHLSVTSVTLSGKDTVWKQGDYTTQTDNSQVIKKNRIDRLKIRKLSGFTSERASKQVLVYCFFLYALIGYF
jgi:hypothetical protein